MRFLLVLTSLTMSLTRCSGSGTSSSFIPDVWLECQSGQAAGCSGNNLPVWVGLSQNLGGVACDTFLTGMNASLRRQSFVASGQATSTRSGIYLTATINSWVNTTGGTIDVLDPGTYSACAFVDLNNNGQIDTNEPTGSGQVTTGQTNVFITDWKPAFN